MHAGVEVLGDDLIDRARATVMTYMPGTPHHLVDDAVQEFCVAWLSVKCDDTRSENEKGRYRWLRARGAALDFLRRWFAARKRDGETRWRTVDMEDLVGDSPDFAERSAVTDFYDRAIRLLDSEFSKKDKAVFLARIVGEKPHEEIATEFGIKQGTSWFITSKVRQRLRALLVAYR